jgi:hypothetical protein
MSIVVDENSAAIDDPAAQPGTGVDLTNPERAVCHLVPGYSNADAVSAAFHRHGHVKVSAGPNDKLAQWQFGFVQFQKVLFAGYYYAGKRRSEGSVSVLVHTQMPGGWILDSKIAYQPWTRPPIQHYSGGTIDAETGDHPMSRVGLKLTNAKTNRENYLFHVVDRREYWSVFADSDDTPKMHPLCAFHWTLTYDIKFVWRNGRAAVAANSSSARLGSGTRSIPADIAQLAQHPTDPMANDVMARAVERAMFGAPPTRVDNEEWFVVVPGDFYS